MRSLLPIVALLAGACNGAPQAADDASPRLDLPAPDTAPDPDQGPLPDLPPPDTVAWAALSGAVVDLQGQPLASAAVAACSSACWPTTGDGQGKFSFPELPPGTLALDVRGPSGAKNTLGVTVFSLQLVSGQQHTLSKPVAVPDVGVGKVLGAGPQPVAVDAELTLTVDKTVMTFPFGVNNPYLAGVKVPQAHWPTYALSHGGATHTALAMWAFKPFDARSKTPLGVSVANGLGLKAGEQAALYVLVAKTGLASWAAEATVSTDGKLLATGAGKGIDRLTWLIVAR